MAKFDLKKAILENKATFFSSLTEGQFSWMTYVSERLKNRLEKEKVTGLIFSKSDTYAGGTFFEKKFEKRSLKTLPFF